MTTKAGRLGMLALFFFITFFLADSYAASVTTFYPSNADAINISFNSSGSNASNYIRLDKQEIAVSATMDLAGYMQAGSGVCTLGSCTAPSPGAVDAYTCNYKVQGTMGSGSSDHCFGGCGASYCTGGRNEHYYFAASSSTCDVGVSCGLCWGAQTCEGAEYACSPGDTITSEVTDHSCSEHEYVYYCNGGWSYCSSGSGASANVFMSWAWSSYPNSPTLDVSNDSTFEFQAAGSFSSSGQTSDFASEINAVLPNCNCSGCIDDGSYCQIPLNISSGSAGIVELSGLNIEMDAPPAMDLIPDKSDAVELSPVKITPTASDPDNDPLTFTFTPPLNASGEWIPTDEDSGTYTVTATVSDGRGGFDSQNFSIIVENLNRPPNLTLDNITINENDTVFIPKNATDPDNENGVTNDDNILSYTLVSNLPFVEDANGWTWKTNFEDAGTYTATVGVTDGEYWSFQQVQIAVNNVNRPPVITSFTPNSADATADENTTIDFSVSTSDPDGDPVSCTWFVDAVEQAQENTLSLPLSFDEPASKNIEVKCNDNDLETTNSWILNINNVNRPPELKMQDLTANENSTVFIPKNATDPDNQNGVANDNNILSYTLVSSLPFVEDANGWTWKTNFEDAGTYTATVEVSDGELTDSQQIQIKVNNVNRAPVLAEIGSREVDENSTIEIQLNASDPDGDPVTYGTNATFGNLNTSTGVFTWAPSFEDSGNYSILFWADDGSSKTSREAMISVKNVNRPPKVFLISPENNKATNESMISHEFYFVDPEEYEVNCELYYNSKLETTMLGVQNNTNTVMHGQAESEGAYVWKISCYDGTDIGTSESRQVIYDKTPPGISYRPDCDREGIYPRDYLYISATVSDSNIDAVTLEWNGTNMTLTNLSSNWYWMKIENLTDGNYTFRIYANDTFGHLTISNETWVSVDTTPPIIESTSPDAGAVGIQTDGGASVTFSEPMKAESVNLTNFYLTGKDGAKVPGSISSNDNTTFTFKPDRNLEYSSAYTVHVDRKVHDLAGWFMDEDYTYSFTTKSKPKTAPSGGGGGGGSAGTPLPQCDIKIGNLGANESGAGFCGNAKEVYISKIKIFAKKDIKNGIIKVIRYTSKPNSLDKPSGTAITYLKIEPINFGNKDIEKAVVYFTIPKSLIESNDATGVLYRNDGDGWEKKEGQIYLSDSSRITYKSEISGFSYFAIGTEPMPAPSKEPEGSEIRKSTSGKEGAEKPAKTTSAEPNAKTRTGFVALIGPRNPKMAAILGALLMAGLLAYGFKSGRISAPKFSMPKLPKAGISAKISKIKALKPDLSGMVQRAGERLQHAKAYPKYLTPPKPIKTTPVIEKRLDLLDDREKEILRALFELGGKTSTAKIQHATGIPTTSLHRWVDTLERKGLVKTETFGKLKKIELTEKLLWEK